jgi:hypothetical protein
MGDYANDGITLPCDPDGNGAREWRYATESDAGGGACAEGHGYRQERGGCWEWRDDRHRILKVARKQRLVEGEFRT